MTFREGLRFWGSVDEVGAMEVFGSTFVEGTRKEDAADSVGRRAEPAGRGGAGMPLNVGGFSLGGLGKRVEGCDILGATSLPFGRFSSGCLISSCVLLILPLLGATCSCGFSKAGTGSSLGSSKAKVGFT